MCGECARLRAENEALRDEVRAWRRNEELRRIDEQDATQLHQMQRLLGCVAQPARLVLALLDTPGKVQGRERLEMRMRSGPGTHRNFEGLSNHLAVQVVHARRALRPLGVTIRTARGVGYLLDAVDAQKLRDLVAA